MPLARGIFILMTKMHVPIKIILHITAMIIAHTCVYVPGHWHHYTTGTASYVI